MNVPFLHGNKSIRCHLSVRYSACIVALNSLPSFDHPIKMKAHGGAWVAQSAKHPILAQVMISQLVGSSPALGSVLTGRSLESASDSVSPSHSALPDSCSLSQK